MPEYTDRSKRVMQLANQEAQRFNHEYIGTEHILLGIVKEGRGVAAQVLDGLDVNLRKIRLEVEKLIQSGPTMVMMGKLPLTPRAKKVLENAEQESLALTLKHPCISTEHLLLGILREQEGVAAQVLTNLGLTLDGVREEILGMFGSTREAGKAAEALEGIPFGRIRVLGLFEEDGGRWVPSDCCFVVKRDGTLKVDFSYRG